MISKTTQIGPSPLQLQALGRSLKLAVPHLRAALEKEKERELAKTREAFCTDGMERQKELWEGILEGFTPERPLMLPWRRHQAIRRILNGGRFGQLRRRLFARTIG